MELKDFFTKLDFSFGIDESNDIKPKQITLSEDEDLSNKLKDFNYIYEFNSPENINTSFYVINKFKLTDEELFKIRRYIWNEDKKDLIFYFNDNSVELNYAKANPHKKIQIANFTGQDESEIEKIKKWNFQSGAFWFYYTNKLNEIKKNQRLDIFLIEQLIELKSKIKDEISKQETKQENLNEITQALIDRTLFIKFLEDNHIINSYFYNFYFQNDLKKNFNRSGYKYFLEHKNKEAINKLFGSINQIFNNKLFLEPNIKLDYLSDKVLDLISRALQQEDFKTGQLSLFDFRFDVIPTEFISHIYEVFLEKNQKDEGIYYTPPQLAELIIDETMTDVGTVLDPACGSGMFLVLAFRKLLEFNPIDTNNVADIITYKNKLIKDYIFGIEKDNTAWRLSIFSLYLEILKGIPGKDIKKHIDTQLKEKKNVQIFPYDFSDNIINRNSLEVSEKFPHNTQKFDFIIGNPPFFKIDDKTEESNFLNKYNTNINGEIIYAKDIIGYKQISQAFMLKIKDWSKPETRFGFVQNSSNFYNEKSNRYRKFFFSYYNIEKFYELSKVKKILFREAKESVIVSIFNNQPIDDNKIDYYKIEMNYFTNFFKILVIYEDKKIELKQADLRDEKISLRDYLIGNEYDLKFINNIKSYSNNLKQYTNSIDAGIRLTGSDKISKIDNTYKELYANDKKKSYEKHKSKFISSYKDTNFNIPYLEYNDIISFESYINKYLNKKDIINKKYRRNKDIKFFEGKKILFRNMPRKENMYIYNAIYNDNTIGFSSSIFSIRLNHQHNYHIITAVLNSYLVSYLLNIKYTYRSKDSHPKVIKSGIENIFIPKILDQQLVDKISNLSKQLTEGELKYEGGVKDELNELIYDLYNLNYLERQRIKDFFIDEKDNADKINLQNYIEALFDTLEIYFEPKPQIEYFIDDLYGSNLVTVELCFKPEQSKNITPKKTIQYFLQKFSQEQVGYDFIYSEKLFGKNSIYIIRDKKLKNWTETMAFEDGQEILKRATNE